MRVSGLLSVAAVALVALAGCQPQGPDPLPPVGEKLVAQQRLDCEKRGGRYGPGGASGALFCFTTPRDAGKSCSRASDCSTSCLARSRSCAPIEPLVGCQDILTDDGARMTQCIE